MNLDSLFSAIEDNDAKQVSKLFRDAKKSGGTIDPSAQLQLLIHTIEMDTLACVRALFTECDPALANAVALSESGQGETNLLGLAVDTENVSMVNALLEYCDPLWQSKHGETVLMRAVQNKDNPNLDAILQQLLPVSEINQCDTSGKTALEHAARALSPKAIRSLISMGGALKTKSSTGKNALMYALSQEADASDKMTCVRLLMEVSDPAQINPRNGCTALLEAMGNGDRAAIELMSSFCDANQQDRQGDTALIIAAGRADVESVKLLLPLSDCTLQNKNGDDAFTVACDTLSRTAEERVFEILSAFPRQVREKHSSLVSLSVAHAHALRLRDSFYAENSPQFEKACASYEQRELMESLKGSPSMPDVSSHARVVETSTKVVAGAPAGGDNRKNQALACVSDAQEDAQDDSAIRNEGGHTPSPLRAGKSVRSKRL